MQIFVKFTVLLMAALSLTNCGKTYSGKKQPKAIKGVMELRGWDFEKDGPVELNGEWEFYWKSFYSHTDFSRGKTSKANFIRVPNAWNDYKIGGKTLSGKGYATYRLVIHSDKIPGAMALKVPAIGTAYRLFINGGLICANGKVGKTKSEMVPEYSHLVADFASSSEQMEIIIHISNFDHKFGGQRIAIIMGAKKQIVVLREKKITLDLFICGALLIMGLYHFTLYFLRRKEMSTLYFGIFCLLHSLKSLVTGDMFIKAVLPDLNWEIQMKLDWIIYATIAIWAMFQHSLFQQDFSKYVLRAMQAMGVFIFITIVFFPARLFTEIVAVYVGTFFLLVIYCFFAAILSLLRKREGSLIFLLGMLFLAIFTVYDTLISLNIISAVHLGSVGLLIFIFSQSFLLSFRFAKSFAAVDALSTNLIKTNIALRKFVPAEFLLFLKKKEITEVRLGDAIQREMTVLFSDIRSFTELSEKMSPDDNFRFINSYLKRVGPLVSKNNGFIDKYIGDAVMALFPDKPAEAVSSAVEMQEGVRQFNEKRRSQGLDPIRIGIGIHVGKLMLGTIGVEERMDSTVISDAVNVAARMEGLTRLYGSYVLVSEAVHAKIGSVFETRLLGRVQVKGKSESVNVYELLDADPEELRKRKIELCDEFEQALELYRKSDFVRAGAIFSKHAEMVQDDTAASLYAKRCADYIQTGAPVSWDGVEVMKGK